MAIHYHHHNTAEDVKRYLSEAARIVEDLALDAELRVKAFELAVSALSTKAAIGTPDVLPAGFLGGRPQ